MPNSFAATADMICPQCQQPFTADLWLIVDAQERPDLSGRGYEGTLHDLPCPHCGHVETLDAPLLIFQPTQMPPLIFFPVNDASPEQNQKHVEALLGLLRRQVGIAWEKRWTAEPNILHWNSPATSPAASVNEYMLLPTIGQLINADSWDKSRRIVESHPELLSDVADDLLTRLAISQEDEDARRVIKVYHALLRRCRIVGIEQAFIEKAKAKRQATGKTAIPAELIRILDDLDRPENRIDMPRRIQLCEQALVILTRSDEPELWASLQAELGNSLMRNLLNERAENLERAIAAYDKALQVRTRQTMPVEWSRTTVNLANAYSDRIYGELAGNIERAIDLYEQALQIMTYETMPIEWAQTTNNLANAYRNRIDGESVENLERAINLYEQALQVVKREKMPVEWAQTTNNLANAYRSRILGEHAKNLEHAINLYNLVLEVRTRQKLPIQWAETTNNLALAYTDRILGDRAQNLERAIDLYGQVLQVTPRQTMPIQWAQTTGNLAIAHTDRIYGDRAENLERAIYLYEQALQVLTQEAMPALWAMTTMNLALAYANRIRGVRAENLEHAINLYEQALTIRTREAMPVEWAMTTMNLANAYADRIRGERAKNLECAIDLYQQALQVRTRKAMPVEWAATTMNLAHAYVDRMDGERAENLERAIELYEQVRQVRTREAMPIQWAETTDKLAGAYNDRIRGERVENLERAIDLYEQALQVRTREAIPVEWAHTTNNLANAYADRIRGVRSENIETAIELYEQVRQVWETQSMPVEWAMTTANLAFTYNDRMRGVRSENLERAIDLYQQALKVRTREAMPVEWAETVNNLANAYVDRIGGKRAENLEYAIDLYQHVLQEWEKQGMLVNWAQTKLNLARAFYVRIQGDRTENFELAIQLIEQALTVYTLDSFPDAYRHGKRRLGDLYLGLERWVPAAEAFQQALRASELLYAIADTPEARQAELAKIRGVPVSLAYTLAKASDTVPDAWRNAVLIVEKNRARWLNESLTLNVEKPAVVPTTVWQTFVAVRTRVHQLRAQSQLPDNTAGKRNYLALAAALASTHKNLMETIDHIRQFYPNFMPEPTFAQIQAAAQQSPLVYLLVTSHGSLALVVYREKVIPVWLKLTEVAFHDLSLDWFGAYGNFRYNRQLTTSQQWMETSTRTTCRLWDDLMEPVAIALDTLVSPDVPGEQKSANEAMPITLIPTGLLSLLPLHAAWTEGKNGGDRRYFMDKFVVNYAPSALTLTHARQTARDITSTHLLAVDEPRPVRGNALPNSAAEVAAIVDYFAQSHLFVNEHATCAAILATLPQAQVVHFSCHGATDWENALESGLAMAHDELLTVHDLLELQLPGARLATLSACETGMIGTNLPDEVVALPSALLQAGFAGVVASLWSVSEISTAMLMARFYDFWQKEGMTPAQALRAAQSWVRDTTNRQKREYFRTVSGAENFFLHLGERQQDACDFAHPYWWAAFYLTGV